MESFVTTLQAKKGNTVGTRAAWGSLLHQHLLYPGSNSTQDFCDPVSSLLQFCNHNMYFNIAVFDLQKSKCIVYSLQYTHASFPQCYLMFIYLRVHSCSSFSLLFKISLHEHSKICPVYWHQSWFCISTIYRHHFCRRFWIVPQDKCAQDFQKYT